MLNLSVLGITTALELIKYMLTVRGLEGKTPEQVLEMWALTRVDVQLAVDEWKASK